jgi:hypothetical protein
LLTPDVRGVARLLEHGFLGAYVEHGSPTISLWHSDFAPFLVFVLPIISEGYNFNIKYIFI